MVNDRDPQGRPELIRLEEIEVVVEPDEAQSRGRWRSLVQADPASSDWIANEQYIAIKAGAFSRNANEGSAYTKPARLRRTVGVLDGGISL